VTWWGGEARHAKKNELIDMFEEENPHISFSREFAAWDAYWERLPTQMAGGNLPDIVFMTERQIGDFESELLDLQPYVDDGTLDLSDYGETFIEGGIVNDRLVMIFLGGTVPALQYNTAFFDEHGVDRPEFEATWQEFHDKGVAISEATGAEDIWGANDTGGSAPLFETYLMQRGLTLFDFQEGTLNFEESHLEEWLGLWNELRAAGGAPPGEVTAEMAGAPFEDSLFARGQTGMNFMNHNQMPIFQQYVDGEMHIALAPLVGDEAEPAALVLGTYMSVSADTEHPEEAALFVDFLLNSDEAIDIMLTDSHGRATKTGFYFDGKRPVLLTLNYSDCPVLCDVQLNALSETIDRLSLRWAATFRF
jgi:multiple sugar transport system substrate-binding protein